MNKCWGYRSSGLGLATVQHLLDAGAYVANLDLHPPKDELPASRVKYWKTNITNSEEVEKAVEASVAWSKETGAVLGGVINCAGVGTAAKVSSYASPTAVEASIHTGYR